MDATRSLHKVTKDLTLGIIQVIVVVSIQTIMALQVVPRMVDKRQGRGRFLEQIF
jgi:hypothetical protein